MKKFLIAGFVLSCLCAQQTYAQSFLSNLLNGVNSAATQSTTTKGSSSTSSNVIGSVLNTAVSTAASSDKISESTGSILTTLIAAVAGDVTTTSSTIVGTWNYTEPCVQFSSQDYLTQAGGEVIANKVEDKMKSIYKLVGIKANKLSFTFEANGNMSYKAAGINRTGTYTFDSQTKTVIITTASGANIKCYVMVSGSNMYLTFDSTKFLTFMKTLGSKFNTLSTVVALANNYEGMKIGFELVKQ